MSWPWTLNWLYKPLTCGSWPVVWKKPGIVLSFSPNVVSSFSPPYSIYAVCPSTFSLRHARSTFHWNSQTTVSLCPRVGQPQAFTRISVNPFGQGSLAGPRRLLCLNRSQPLRTARLAHRTSRRMSSLGLLWKSSLCRLKNSHRKSLLSSFLAITCLWYTCLPYVQPKPPG